MSQITQTRIIVTSTNQDFTIQADFSEAQVRASYASDLPGLANMDATVTVDGSTRIITFRNRTGTKGAAILRTRIVVTPTNQDFTIMGDYDEAFVRTNYAAELTGLANMDASVTVEGDTRVITFRNRTGTKG